MVIVSNKYVFTFSKWIFTVNKCLLNSIQRSIY